MSTDFARQRQIMVDSQVRTQDVTNVAIIEAMRVYPRESLVPAGKSWLAYADAEVEYAPGRWMLRPRDVGKLLQGLGPRAGERALAIAAPYAGAILAAVGLEVQHLDGDDLQAISGSFDVIVCEGAVTRAPQAWLDALGAAGRLGVVERQGPVGRAMLYLRTGTGVGGRPIFDSTPPILAGFEAKAQFAL